MKKRSKTLDEMTKEVKETFNAYVAQGTKRWNWQSAAKDLPYQVGSITKIMLQLTNERWPEGKTKKQLKAELGDELADVMAEVLFMAAQLDINLEEAWQNMLKSDKRKVNDRVKSR